MSPEELCLAAGRVARSKTHEELRDDAAQEAALRVWVSIRQGADRISFVRHGRHAAIDTWRKERGARPQGVRRNLLYLERYADSKYSWQEWMAAPEESTGLSETALRVRCVLSQMHPPHREVLEQVLMEGRTIREYALDAGRTEDTIAKRLMRARIAFEALWYGAKPDEPKRPMSRSKTRKWEAAKHYLQHGDAVGAAIQAGYAATAASSVPRWARQLEAERYASSCRP